MFLKPHGYSRVGLLDLLRTAQSTVKTPLLNQSTLSEALDVFQTGGCFDEFTPTKLWLLSTNKLRVRDLIN